MSLNDYAVNIIKDDLFAGGEGADVGAPTEEGIADIGEGFDASFTESKPPTRELFNGIHRRISAVSRELIYGVIRWDTRLTYPLGALVIDNAILYRSLVASNTGNEPSTDDGTNWRPLLGQSADTTQAVTFQELVTLDKNLLLKNQSNHPAAPANVNDNLLYSLNGRLWVRTTALQKRVLLEGEDSTTGQLNLSPSAAPSSGNNNSVTIYSDTSGVLRATLWRQGSPLRGKRILVQDTVSNLALDGYIDLASASSSRPNSGRMRLRHDGSTIRYYFNSGSEKIVADREWTNAQTFGSNRLNSNAVTTAKITDGAVVESKIANSAVTTSKIANANIVTSKIADNNVTEPKLADNIFAPIILHNIDIEQDNNPPQGRRVRSFNTPRSLDDFVAIELRVVVGNNILNVSIDPDNITSDSPTFNLTNWQRGTRSIPPVESITDQTTRLVYSLNTRGVTQKFAIGIAKATGRPNVVFYYVALFLSNNLVKGLEPKCNFKALGHLR